MKKLSVHFSIFIFARVFLNLLGSFLALPIPGKKREGKNYYDDCCDGYGI